MEKQREVQQELTPLLKVYYIQLDALSCLIPSRNIPYLLRLKDIKEDALHCYSEYVVESGYYIACLPC